MNDVEKNIANVVPINKFSTKLKETSSPRHLHAYLYQILGSNVKPRSELSVECYVEKCAVIRCFAIDTTF